MMKNEKALIRPFLRYHGALFGAENLYVIDNGSNDPEVLDTVAEFEREGVNVDRSYPRVEDFRLKGTIISNLVKRLDMQNSYDFYILLDCDEFVALDEDGTYCCDRDSIHSYIDSFRGEERMLKVSTNLSNILGWPGAFQAAPYSKTIFPKNVLLTTDDGFHGGVSRNNSGYISTNLVYVHFHYRPYDEVVKFARQKLASEISETDLNNPDVLRHYKGRGWHMIGYLLGGAESYYSQFRDVRNAVMFPNLLERFRSLGLNAPFSDFMLPPVPKTTGYVGLVNEKSGNSTEPYLVVDEANVKRVRGWGINRADQTAEPLFLRFTVDGAVVFEGRCDKLRADVLAAGYSTASCGFDFMMPPLTVNARNILSITDEHGKRIRMFFKMQPCYEIDIDNLTST
jgi:hypothetical protein